jgi:hypothetical protein
MRYSNAKHWCPLCKTFVQRDARSIRIHEESLRHLGVVKRRLTQAARLKENSAATGISLVVAPSLSSSTVKDKVVDLRSDEVLGQYCVRSVVYLQGEYHEDLLLLHSSSIQMSLLDEDGEPGSWTNCKVVAFDSFSETYLASFETEDGRKETVNVLASDLRILGPTTPSIDPNQWIESKQLSTHDSDGEDEMDVTLESEPKVYEMYKGVAVDEEEVPPQEEKQPQTQAVQVAFRKRQRPVI